MHVTENTQWHHSFIWHIQWYRKNPRISDTRKFAAITLDVEQAGVSLE